MQEDAELSRTWGVSLTPRATPRSAGHACGGPLGCRSKDENVNQKTAKVLKRFAATSGKTAKEMKKWWLGLNRNEREAEGRKIRAKTA